MMRNSQIVWRDVPGEWMFLQEDWRQAKTVEHCCECGELIYEDEWYRRIVGVWDQGIKVSLEVHNYCEFCHFIKETMLRVYGTFSYCNIWNDYILVEDFTNMPCEIRGLLWWWARNKIQRRKLYVDKWKSTGRKYIIQEVIEGMLSL